MATEIGEYLVGAYLKLVEHCHLVDYNVRAPGGKLEGLNELDVVGINIETNTAYLCEVMTHVRGLLYGGGNEGTVKRVEEKFQKQKNYAERHLSGFEPEYMFWSPNVPVGMVDKRLAQIPGLRVVINGEYKRRVELLQKKARAEKQDTGNPVFRVFQILGSMRD
jgi:hypothetical protein